MQGQLEGGEFWFLCIKDEQTMHHWEPLLDASAHEASRFNTLFLVQDGLNFFGSLLKALH